MSTEVASTGRGAGNIGPPSQDVHYTDSGDIVRAGDSDTGPAKFSTGRGGAGNIRSPSHPHLPSDAQDVAVEPVPVVEESAPVSTGRGGAGNIASKRRSFIPSGLGDKLKKMLAAHKKDKKEKKPRPPPKLFLSQPCCRCPEVLVVTCSYLE
ncbi:uncharacterized protein V1510DRAFT_166059 [Dipodascopsis tothii]|uniref:uncharacterized protein n=1 Tax=Dipodascopsis tothii TaxID=44089 RepID=UPI0034CE271A